MKKLIFAVAFLVFVSSTAFAQVLTYEKTFTVTGYSTQQMGYPLQIVPGEDGGFSYVELWMRGSGRKFPNYYIQGYNKKFEENWFHPVTDQNSPEMEPIDLIRMKNSLLLIGKQVDPTIKGIKTVMQGYELDGDHMGSLQKISLFDKKAKKGFENQTYLSPDSTKLLWLGTNPAEDAKKRRYLISVWTDQTRSVWSKELILPHSEEGYQARQVTLDNRGNAYFLMTFEQMTNTIKDTLNLPMILRYDYREKKFTEYKLDIPAASVPEGQIHITQNGKLVFLGILADGSANGFVNGAKSIGTGLMWNKIIFKQFDIERELKLAQEYQMEIPASWVSKYAAEGANFSRAEVREVGNKLFWVMEENFTQTHNEQLQHLFYDVGIVAIDMSSGEISWATSFDKKQRDYVRGNLLSYVLGVTSDKLQFVYLNERGAQGKIICTSVDMQSGEVTDKILAKNQQANYLFFPGRSSMISSNQMLLMGVGNPVGNDYKLMLITFP